MIYIACPGGYRTGGVELLHQLAHELHKYTDVRMWYVVGGGTVPEYAKYQTDYVYELPDNNDYVVVPEIWARMDMGHHKRIIFWESVDNYLDRDDNLTFGNEIIHLSQSAYSYDFLVNKVRAKNIIRVTDYINEDYTADFREGVRAPIVLYNPVKGIEYTQKVIAQCNAEFKTIKCMTRDEVIRTMRGAMVYIDLGHHPGKDRMPREAAASGCAILTSLNGSAKFYEDVPIPDRYKLDRNEPAAIAHKIEYMLANYDTIKKDFDAYRVAIRAEKDLFRMGVKELYDVLHYHSGL